MSVRGYIRRRISQPEDAATKIQAVFRGHAARKGLKGTKAVKDIDPRHGCQMAKVIFLDCRRFALRS